MEPEEGGPISYVTGKRDHAQRRVNALEDSISKLKLERKEARIELEQWQKVVETLRGETDG